MKRLELIRTTSHSYLSRWYCFESDSLSDRASYHGSEMMLSDLKSRVELWLSDNPDLTVVVKHNDTAVSLMSEEDWAIAILTYGP